MFLFQNCMVGGKEPKKEEKRMKGVEREDEDSVKRKTANTQGKKTFRIPNSIMLSSSSGSLHVQFLLPRKLLCSVLLFVSHPEILLCLFLFSLQRLLRYDFLDEDFCFMCP